MRDALLLLAIFAAAYGGFALIAMSQAKHWKRVTVAPPDTSGRVSGLRCGGAAFVFGSLVLALLRDAVSFGILLWVMLISVAAVAVVFTLTWRPKWFRLASMVFAANDLRERTK